MKKILRFVSEENSEIREAKTKTEKIYVAILIVNYFDLDENILL